MATVVGMFVAGEGGFGPPNLPGQSRTCCQLHHSPMVWLPGAAPGASRARTGCSPDELEPVSLRAEGGTRTRTPFVGTRLSTWRVYRSTTFALTVGQADQSLLGVPTPATAGTSGGYAPAQEAREIVTEQPGAEGETCTRTPRRAPASEAGMSAFHHFRLRPSPGQSLPGVSTPGPGGTRAGGPPGREALCRRGDLPPHTLRHRVLGPACLRSTTSAGAPPVGAGWSPPTVLVPRTGFEPVISSLRGRRVGRLHQRGLGSGRRHGGMGRPGRCGACRTRTDRLLIASEVLFLMS
jgi:hypothetical protein